VVGTAEFNADGRVDLVWQNTQTGDVVYWILNDQIKMETWDYIARGVPTNWKIAAIMSTGTAFKNNIIWRSSSTGDVTVWDMSGPQWTGNWDIIARGVPSYWQIVRPH